MGNTPAINPAAPAFAVHPHTHGEHMGNYFHQATILGSSPHAWGTLFPGNRFRKPLRFIPTRMGNTRR